MITKLQAQNWNGFLNDLQAPQTLWKPGTKMVLEYPVMAVGKRYTVELQVLVCT